MTAKSKTWWSERNASVSFLNSQSQCCVRKEAPTAEPGWSPGWRTMNQKELSE